MVDTIKSRIAKLQRHLEVPRELYLAAVDRQEDRAWATWCDPRPHMELQKRVDEIRKNVLPHLGEVYEPSKEPQPHPSLFDSKEDIARDEVLISVYLKANPMERRRPMARGKSHEELFDYWKKSPFGSERIRREQELMNAAVDEIRAKYLPHLQDKETHSDDAHDGKDEGYTEL